MLKSSAMIRDLAAIFFALFTISPNISGQVIEEKRAEPGLLALKIKSISFIKNNEYYNPLIEGYTMPGFFFQPELVYSPSSKISLKAGIHLLKYSGADKFTQVRPVFSTTLNLTEKTSITIGTLSGSDKHQLFDPHFNSERLYNAYAEDGFQLTTVTDNLFNDTWISWENFIFKGDTTREVFTYGESFRYKSSPVADFVHFEVPVQIQFKHFGGQISNYPEPVQTFFNLAAGLRINFDLAQKKYGLAGVEYLQFINNQLNGVSPGGISHGYASWIRLHYKYKVLYIGAAYWKSHNFFAPNGDYIYSSVSDYQNVIVPDRKIITNTFYLTVLPESYLEVFLGFETYYDINLKRLDNALTLHLNFEKLFILATFKK